MTEKKQEPPAEPQAEADVTKLLVRALYDVQKMRIALKLRIDGLEREGKMTAAESERMFGLPFCRFQEAEMDMERSVWQQVKNEPIVKGWLIKVKGIGPRLSGLLVANIGDIGRFDTVSKLWAYCGLHVDKDGLAVKRVKGIKSNWNTELKITAWKIANSFVRVAGGSPYRVLYEQYKARILGREIRAGNIIWQTVNDKLIVAHVPEGVEEPEKPPKLPQWTLGRIDNMSKRYIAKRMLSHLWQVWREMKGLPTRPTYAVEYQQHTHTDDPWDYVEADKK